MQLKDIKELIRVIKDSDFTTFEMEEEGFKIKLKREKEIMQVAVAAPVSGPAPVMYNGPQVAYNVPATEKAAPVAAAKEAAPAVAAEGTIIKSPIVGTFYDAPSPESAPFVTVGSKVKKGDVLCIIEAMKLMNEIEADKDGVVTEICVSKDQMVEFGQPLFRIV